MAAAFAPMGTRAAAHGAAFASLPAAAPSPGASERTSEASRWLRILARIYHGALSPSPRRAARPLPLEPAVLPVGAEHLSQHVRDLPEGRVGLHRLDARWDEVPARGRAPRVPSPRSARSAARGAARPARG